MGLTEDVVQLTQDMVKFQTTKNQPEEIGECIDYVKNYFSDDDFVVKDFENEGKKSLIISFEETKEPEVMLHGHIDVVEAEEDMFEPEVRDGKIYGRGTADMKAGVACLMKLMKDLREEKPDIGLMIVSDEEIGGFKGAKYLVDEENYRPNFLITAEPNNVGGYLDIVTKQKGIIKVDIEVKGSSAHSARLWKGDNAAEKLMRIYESEIKSLFPENKKQTWETTCNLGILEAGEASNKVPDKANMTLDIRWSNSYPGDEVLSDLRDVDGAKISGSAVNEPMLDTDPEDYYVKGLQETAQNLIGECEVTRKEHGSDARHFSAKDIPAVVFGPEGYNSHESGEYAVADSFEDYIEILKDFINKKNS